MKLAEEKLNGNLHAVIIEMIDGKLKYDVQPAPDGAVVFYPEKNYVLPIPQSAIDRNVSLEQNPGYWWKINQ